MKHNSYQKRNLGRVIELQGLGEGEIYCKWLRSRLIRNNKNVLGAELGSTGSGKSYRDLRKGELWYKDYFKEKFPTKNICFGIPAIMKLISSGKLRKGELIIFEEAGANMGSLDFQNRVSKMMAYVLQSFRSMNIGILFNLPYLSMLNKTARMLLHYSFESAGIDYKNKISKCKPKFHQVNQSTGKIYYKYPVVKVNGAMRKIKRFSFSLPSDYLIEAYEKKKVQYLTEMTSEYDRELDELEKEQNRKMGRTEMTDKQLKVYELLQEGHNQTETAQLLGKTQQSVNSIAKTIRKYGYKIEIDANAQKNKENEIVIVNPRPQN